MRRWGLITQVSRMPSKLVNNWSAQTNFPPTHLQPTPTGRAQIFARFRTFTNFFKNVPDYRNRSNFARGPNLTHSSIWEKKNLGVRKKGSFLIFRPLIRFEVRCDLIFNQSGDKCPFWPAIPSSFLLCLNFIRCSFSEKFAHFWETQE